MSIGYSPKIATDGLVLCLDAGNRKSYPGSGNIWYDLSFSKNNGTATTLSVVSDPSSNVVNLDTSTEITCTFSQQINKYNFTFSYWGRPTATPDSNYQRIARLLDSVNPHGYYFNIDTREVATPYVLHYVKDFYINSWDARTMINQSQYNEFKWGNYVLVMKDENNWESYYNGVFLGRNSTPSQDLSPFGNITSMTMGAGANFRINNVTMYNRPLSASEVKQNFDAIRGRYGI